MTPRTLCIGLAIAALLAPRAWAGEASSTPQQAASEPMLRARQRLLQAEAAVLERLVRRHQRGDDLSGAVLSRQAQPATKAWPSQTEVHEAQRALVRARALLLQRKAVLAARTRSRTTAKATAEAPPGAPSAPSAPVPPNTTSSPIEAGTYLYRAGAYAEALAAWKRVAAEKLERDPGRLLRFGSAAEYSGDRALGRRTYELVRERFPRSRQATDAGFRLRFLDWAADLHPDTPEQGDPRR